MIYFFIKKYFCNLIKVKKLTTLDINKNLFFINNCVFYEYYSRKIIKIINIYKYFIN